MSLHDIYCSGMCEVLTRFSVNLAIFFILSQHVSQIVMLSLKDQTLLLSTYHSSFVFRSSQVQISLKRLIVLTDIFLALYCKLSYYSSNRNSFSLTHQFIVN
jgi:hypothetical protein